MGAGQSTPTGFPDIGDPFPTESPPGDETGTDTPIETVPTTSASESESLTTDIPSTTSSTETTTESTSSDTSSESEVSSSSQESSFTPTTTEPPLPPILPSETQSSDTQTQPTIAPNPPPKHDGPNVVAIVVPVLCAIIVLAALATVLLIRRKRRAQSRRLLEDFQQRQPMGEIDPESAAFFPGVAQKPYQPTQHATYTPPVVDGSLPEWASAPAPYPPQSAPGLFPPGLHPGWRASMHDSAETASLGTQTTLVVPPVTSRPLSPGPPVLPSSSRPGPITIPTLGSTTVPVPAPEVTAPPLSPTPTEHSIGTAVEHEDRRQLRVVNAQSNATVQLLATSPTSPRPATGSEAIGEDVLKAWMRD